MVGFDIRYAVKNGILGRSRSAGSRRNRFYQPSDAVRFRALNSLSPGGAPKEYSAEFNAVGRRADADGRAEATSGRR